MGNVRGLSVVVEVPRERSGGRRPEELFPAG